MNFWPKIASSTQPFISRKPIYIYFGILEVISSSNSSILGSCTNLGAIILFTPLKSIIRRFVPSRLSKKIELLYSQD